MSDATGVGGPVGTGLPAAPLRRVAVRGLLWTSGQRIATRLLNTVTFIVLARLLTPQEYGLVALAAVFIALVQVFIDSGFSRALVQMQEVDRKDLNTVFWVGMSIAVAMTAVMWAAAGPLADLFHEARLAGVLRWMSLAFVFGGLSSAHQAILQRRLAFRSLAVRNVVSSVASAVVGIGAAVAGFGVWSLVAQVVAQAATGTLALWIASGWRPGFAVSGERLATIFAFSRNVLGTGLLNFLNRRTDDFLIGTVLGPAALGLYSVAYRLLLVIIDVAVGSIQTVAYPAFARLQDNRERLGRAYTSATRMCAAISMPVFLFMAAAAPTIVQVFFGERWERSAGVMRILCMFGLLTGILQFNSAVLWSVNRPELVFRTTLLSTGLQVVAFAIAVRFGIEWVAASFVIRAYVVAPLPLYLATREISLDIREHLMAFLSPLAATGAMVVAVLAVNNALLPYLGAVPRLALLVAVGAPTYLLALGLFGRSILHEMAVYARAAGAGRLRRPAPAVRSSAEAA